MSKKRSRTRIGLVRLGLAVAAVLGGWGPSPAYGQSPSQSGQDVYYPGPGDRWERRPPENVGMDGRILGEAIELATALEHEGAPRDLRTHLLINFSAREPMGELVTWDMLLRQTSEWEGELWGKPTWSDRFDGEIRELQEPGTFYEYTDS